MNKTVKRSLSLLLALCMVLLGTVTAFAAEQVDITITGDNSQNSGFAAYRVLDLTTSTVGAEVKYAYTVNEKYADVLLSAINSVDGDSIKNAYTGPEMVAFIENLKDDANAIRTFADALYKAITGARLTAESTTEDKRFTGMPQGYYLIAETSVGSEKPTDAYSLVMLNTAGNENITVSTKESIPTVVKKVYGNNDAAWQDYADYNVGDEVPFRLTGTVPEHIGNYENYYYAFHDKMHKTLRLNADSLKVYVDEVAESKRIDNSKYTLVTEGLTDGCTFEVRFADLNDVAGLTKDSKIIVDYTAELLPGAVIGNPGNLNTVHLEYSNDPYSNGKGETVKDTVAVFTFEMAVVKVDGDNAVVTLPGAEFVLQRMSDSMYVQLDATGAVTGWTTAADEATPLVSGEDGSFCVIGLERGTYYLTETAAPDGYNLLTDAIKVVITPSYGVHAQNGSEITVLSATVDVAADGKDIVDASAADTGLGVVSFTVANHSGVLLPTTGGMGTTIFYIAGGVLVVLSLVLLISRKRMKREG